MKITAEKLMNYVNSFFSDKNVKEIDVVTHEDGESYAFPILWQKQHLSKVRAEIILNKIFLRELRMEIKMYDNRNATKAKLLNTININKYIKNL